MFLYFHRIQLVTVATYRVHLTSNCASFADWGRSLVLWLVSCTHRLSAVWNLRVCFVEFCQKWYRNLCVCVCVITKSRLDTVLYACHFEFGRTWFPNNLVLILHCKFLPPISLNTHNTPIYVWQNFLLILVFLRAQVCLCTYVCMYVCVYVRM